MKYIFYKFQPKKIVFSKAILAMFILYKVNKRIQGQVEKGNMFLVCSRKMKSNESCIVKAILRGASARRQARFLCLKHEIPVKLRFCGH
jgi:hypothetical protein